MATRSPTKMLDASDNPPLIWITYVAGADGRRTSNSESGVPTNSISIDSMSTITKFRPRNTISSGTITSRVRCGQRPSCGSAFLRMVVQQSFIVKYHDHVLELCRADVNVRCEPNTECFAVHRRATGHFRRY